MPFKWSFQQLGEPNKLLELEGYLAPFGRPRQKPIMKELIKSRVQSKHYPGSNRPPTRSVFGSNWEPMELSGRWMTKSIAGHFDANDLADNWTLFMRDEQLVRMAWGQILSYTVFIDELELGRESQHEIAWRMHLLVDSRDELTAFNNKIEPVKNVTDKIFEVNEFLANTKGFLLPNIPDLSFDFLDKLDFFAGQLNQFSAAMNKLAGQIDDLEKGTFSTLQHFRGAVTGFKTALLTIRDTVQDAGIQSAVAVHSAESDVRWAKYQADLDFQTSFILGQLAEMDRTAEILSKKDLGKVLTAEQGDTWESISTRATGGPDKASDIRSANGIEFGTPPTPGEIYLVP